MPPATKIAIVLPPREGFGPGRAGAIALLVRRFTETPGFETTVFGGRQDGPTFPRIDFRPTAPAMWPPASSNLRYSAAVASAIRKLQPAAVEVHNRTEIALDLRERLPDIPIVAWLHNDPQAMRQNATPEERAEMLRKMARVVVPSQYLRARMLEGVTAPARDVFVLPNCLDLGEVPAHQKKERLVLFAGRVVADKGPDAFVAAWTAASAYLTGWNAEIIGADRFNADSPDTVFVQTVRGAAEGAGVRMLGYRDHTEVLQRMARAAIVVVPSRWPEPFGLVALEALASGAALICSPRGGLPEVAGNAAIYADPDKPAEIAAAIRLLAADEQKRQELAAAGLDRARQFDVPVIRQRLTALRRALAGG